MIKLWYFYPEWILADLKSCLSLITINRDMIFSWLNVNPPRCPCVFDHLQRLAHGHLVTNRRLPCEIVSFTRPKFKLLTLVKLEMFDSSLNKRLEERSMVEQVQSDIGPTRQQNHVNVNEMKKSAVNPLISLNDCFILEFWNDTNKRFRACSEMIRIKGFVHKIEWTGLFLFWAF